MLKHDLLDGVAHFHLLLAGIAGLEKTVESGAADRGQPAHRLHSKAALRRHHVPGSLPRCHCARAGTAPGESRDLFAGSLQKIHFQRLLRQRFLQLKVLLAKPLFGRPVAASLRSRCRPARHEYKSWREIPSSRHNCATFGATDKRRSAVSRNSCCTSHTSDPFAVLPSLQTVKILSVSLSGCTPGLSRQAGEMRHPIFARFKGRATACRLTPHNRAWYESTSSTPGGVREYLVATVVSDCAFQSSHIGIPRSRGGVGDALIGFAPKWKCSCRCSSRSPASPRNVSVSEARSRCRLLRTPCQSPNAPPFLGCAEEIAVGVGDQAS